MLETCDALEMLTDVEDGAIARWMRYERESETNKGIDLQRELKYPS